MYQKLLRANIASLAPYSTARDEYQGEIGIYLDANESPYENNGYNRYPDPYQKELKREIASRLGIATDRLFIGNGSDEPIDLLYRMFCNPGKDNAVAIAPTYGMYKVAAAINDIEYREVQLTEEFDIDCDKILSSVDEYTKLLFICSPNNPTGNAFERSKIEFLIANFKGIVVIDEAYIHFSAERSFVADSFDNVVVLRTLSKAWGLAGLRLGLAVGPEWLVEVMTKVKYPYNINVVTQRLVLEQLQGRKVQDEISEILAQREMVVAQLEGMERVLRVYPSDSNFVLIKVERARELYDELIEAGVIVRDRSRIPGCAGCLRITIGLPEENFRMLEIIGKRK